ncbi:MAG: response regulator [Pedobacter sp.]|nr:response regulator [Pedobacter sp.]
MIKYEGLDCILLIDDDTPTNFLHSIIIKRAGIDAIVQTHTSAIDALAYLTSTGPYEGKKMIQPGIIFLDINMPAMNGWDFLDEYGKLPEEQKAKITIIMLTTSLNPSDRERAESYEDVVTYLHKPLILKNLQELIATYFKPILTIENL